MSSSTSEPSPPEIQVFAVPSSDCERFVVVDVAAFEAAFLRAFVSTSTTGERVAAIGDHLRAYPLLDATTVRVQLRERGLADSAIDAHLARARRMITVLAGTPTSFERITRPGFVNADGQEVLRRTDRFGPDGQRVFVMHCRVCGDEYGSYGCDADIRRCPRCQDGPPGVAMTA
jgi:hypothetical protein